FLLDPPLDAVAGHRVEAVNEEDPVEVVQLVLEEACAQPARLDRDGRTVGVEARGRSEEHTSELQSRFDLVCRLLLEKKKSDRMACPLRFPLRLSTATWVLLPISSLPSPLPRARRCLLRPFPLRPGAHSSGSLSPAIS